jgi:hypothetical protein
MSQINTGSMLIEWKNRYLDTGLLPITITPVVGVVSSAISFRFPQANSSSTMDLKLIPKVELNTGDRFTIRLTNFSFPWSTNTIVGGMGMTWYLTWDEFKYELNLTSSQYMPPSTVTLSFSKDLAPTLPSNGMTPTNAPSMCQIALETSENYFGFQSISSIDAVGYIDSMKVRTVAESRADRNGVFFDFDRGVFFDVHFNVSSGLKMGDQIHVYAPDFSFHYDAQLVLETEYVGHYTARTLAKAETIIIEVTNDLELTHIRVKMKPSNLLEVPVTKCDVTKKDCPVYISIISEATPIFMYKTIPESLYFFPKASISFDATTFLPTEFPTADPTPVPTFSPTTNSSRRRLDDKSWDAENQGSHIGMNRDLRKLSASLGYNIGDEPNFYLSINLNFTLYSSILNGTEFQITLPHVKPEVNSGTIGNNVTIEVIPLYLDMPVHFEQRYDGKLQTLYLTVLRDFYAGETLSVTVGSPDLKIEDTSIYENDLSFVYSLSYDGETVNVGTFDFVRSRGLRTSILEIDDKNSRLSGFNVEVSVDSNSSPFIYGDKLFLYLPASTSVNGDIANLNYTSTTPILASWSQENHTIDITIMGNNIDSVDIFFSKNSSLSLPLHGFNEESGLPMIAYVSPSNGSYYEYTAFNTFYPYYIAYGSSLEFSTPAYSGQENDLTITLNLTMA